MMNETSSSSLEFHPDRAAEQIPGWIKSCQKVEELKQERTLVVYLSNSLLNEQELGRLLIINGKCRNEGIKLVLHCEDPVARQLSQTGLDRLMWVQVV